MFDQQSPTKLTRQQLYDRIRESSKDEYILAEMKRLGFWNESEDRPSLSESLIKKQGELERELRELLVKQRQLQDPEKALAIMHKQRMKDAREQREITRQRRAEQRYQRSLSWYNKNQQTLTYLGEKVSSRLDITNEQQARLLKNQLPLINSHLQLATLMGISLAELRFLAFSRKVSKVSHYQHFLLPKKSGGVRLISAPMPRLKRLQYWVQVNILEPVVLHDAAHGFVPQRSIVSNAAPHVGKAVVINMDLADFFPSISYPRVKGLFNHLGYGEGIATVLALLTTAQTVTPVELDGEHYFVGQGERHIPQGAPSSPALTNILCRRLDKRILGAAQKLGFAYTRYADDLSFSSAQGDTKKVRQLLWRVKQIIKDEGFAVHPDKTRVMYRHKRQEVTGVVVNDKLAVERRTLKKFRALLFQIEKEGIAGKTWGKINGDDPQALIAAIEGYVNYVAMVSPEKGIVLQQRVVQIKQQYGVQVSPTRIMTLNRKLFKQKAAKGEAPRDNWWQPVEKKPPVQELTPLQLEAKKKQAKQPLPPVRDANPQEQIRLQPDTTKKTSQSEKHHYWIIFWICFLLLLVVMMN
ncbi:reverse transcriptase family protein [Spartinivicinus poritis]|uniref:RNA-directed DNA polymerase n=1 Tax=Spartinivicinus poritis TaxID=2994640 RepID=A0ABT5UBI9_9GAMM|nr:reverse transcriptase family protein [Spartinivicinus sp. A2-2]MDE1463735.1 reverse transcriptase family protein [Spartinivicinus sp. A2-2]